MKKNIIHFFFLPLLLLLTSGSFLFALPPIRSDEMKGAGVLEARQKLLTAAEAYLGTPYRYGGVNRSGLDCSGLVYLSFRDAIGAGVPRTAGALFAWVERMPDAQLRAGDLVFFITGGAGVSHVGIYAGDGRFIHSASEGPKTGVMYSRLDESYWKRTYAGAGRALPWDSWAEAALAETALAEAALAEATLAETTRVEAARADAANSAADEPVSRPVAQASGGDASVKEKTRRRWKEEKGFFTGAGLSFNFGGFVRGAPSVFRGLNVQGKIGYKGLLSDSFQIALELRPGFDRALGIGRIPITLSLGNDIFQVFAGPGFTIGDPSLDIDGGRGYHPRFSFLAETGVQLALPAIQIADGALSFFGECAWQPFSRNSGVEAESKADATANLRVSMGARYLWFIGDGS